MLRNLAGPMAVIFSLFVGMGYGVVWAIGSSILQ